MTHVVRYEADGAVRVGVLGDGGVRPVPGVSSMSALLALGLDEARALVEGAAAGGPVTPLAAVRLLPPVDGLTEVWASGVTYERSMDARVEESQVQDVYSRVYAADRPELFLKSVAWRVVTDGEPIAARPDSAVTVPEPELAVVVTATAEVFGYTVCDDVSSRDIEGENPLYLPQAKIYAGSCALATGIRPAWEVPDPTALTIGIRVTRGGSAVFEETTSTARMHRTVPDLVAHLVAAQDFPGGAVLSTGTGIVPDLDFTLLEGDVVEVDVEHVGTLTNPVASLAVARAARADHHVGGVLR
ncbi:fumarylacetoacetate hydrolase family protein [Blastococcus haudaquaticus]|uniref:2-dehydro-3-deoxy-D-arabinonate dehydratase n=1 Tax=Blastococcus haudaquaticus TaxID=1938745 RepID=A0A286H9A6_9ACTN|nr:fumarylacetoacetate hydrolase family protein [Blastococcus haudaquaticus]SOE03834.1 2-dehydro-3-deoxy-D-arabinonate dehydratase [Blastococcus haudaquaticus]